MLFSSAMRLRLPDRSLVFRRAKPPLSEATDSAPPLEILRQGEADVALRQGLAELGGRVGGRGLDVPGVHEVDGGFARRAACATLLNSWRFGS